MILDLLPKTVVISNIFCAEPGITRLLQNRTSNNVITSTTFLPKPKVLLKWPFRTEKVYKFSSSLQNHQKIKTFHHFRI